MEDLLKEYATLSIKIKADEARKEVLKVLIEEELVPGEAIETPMGEFKMVSRKGWKYSAAHKELKEKLGELEIEEQEREIAVPTESHFLRFVQTKGQK